MNWDLVMSILNAKIVENGWPPLNQHDTDIMVRFFDGISKADDLEKEFEEGGSLTWVKEYKNTIMEAMRLKNSSGPRTFSN